MWQDYHTDDGKAVSNINISKKYIKGIKLLALLFYTILQKIIGIVENETLSKAQNVFEKKDIEVVDSC